MLTRTSFDSTITVNDTIELLMYSMVRCRQPNDEDPGHTKAWEQFKEASRMYYKDYESYASIAIKEKDRTTYAREVDYQRDLFRVERRSLKRICERGLFHELSSEQAKASIYHCIGKDTLKYQRGFARFIKSLEVCNQTGLTGPGNSWGVVSVNWDVTFVETCVATALLQSGLWNEQDKFTVPAFSNWYDTQQRRMTAPGVST
jgi:hypothetical protein